MTCTRDVGQIANLPDFRPSGRLQSCTIDLEDLFPGIEIAAFTYHFTVYDALSQASSTPITVVVDKIVPTVTINSPQGNEADRAVTIDIEADEDSELSYSLDGSSFYTLCSSCSRKVKNVWLRSGPHTITAKAKDEAGNTDTEMLLFEVS